MITLNVGHNYLGNDDYEMTTKRNDYFGMITFSPYLINDYYLGKYYSDWENHYLENNYNVRRKWLNL